MKIWHPLIAILAFALAMPVLADDQTTNTRIPASDPSNSGEWILNPNVSDEFSGTKLEESKWLIQGRNGVYQSNWIGRAPSQFSTENVRLENGMLKIQSRWEPDFEFSEKRDFSWKEVKEGLAYENVTTAAVICKNEFLYGYMEIKCKAADASVTSAFWATGSKTELDIFEFSGRPKQKNKTHLESELWSSIHDWSKPGGPSTWTDRLQLDWKVAEGFHVYGVDWDPDYLKFYADGQLVRTVTRAEIGDEAWVLRGPIKIWVDSEIFPWHGIPEKEDLPADYEIEYIRVWQNERSKVVPQPVPTKTAMKSENLGASQSSTFSFDGPIEIGTQKQDWYIAADSKPYFSITGEKAVSGKKALKFNHSGALPSKAVAFAPYGSLSIPPGQSELSLKVWLEPNASIEKLNIILEDPWLELKPFDLSGIETGKWVTLTQTFQRQAASKPKDRIRILVLPSGAGQQSSTLYIDDLAVSKQ